jgi:serine/threonine protein kinase
VNTGTYTPAGTEPLIDRLRRAVIGRYDVYAELGSGGMASVFLALDLALERKVAIKVMSPALANSPDNVERFKREAKVAAALNHPNIIGILAVGDDPELAFFVMKYVEGRSLDSVIKDEGPQPVTLVQSVIASAGKALFYAHTRGVIHRDVKPANFMLDRDGWLVVTDFGIAKQADVKGLTMTGSLIGTPYYMSPEQYHGRPVSPSADQYALGIVAYELLTGTAPYTGDTVAEVMRGHLFDDVPNVRAVRPDVPVELEACIARMMAKKPEERFPTLEEAVIAFGAISPTQEVVVRTQIIELAKIGAEQQPQMRVPLSPVPLQRPPQTVPVTRHSAPGADTVSNASTAETAVFDSGVRASKLGRAAAPSGRAQEPASRSRLPLVVGLLLAVAGTAGAAAWLRPGLFASLGIGGPGGVAVPPLDSTAIRDSIDRAVLARIAIEDSVASADSIARILASARTDSIARADSIVRADSAARATAAARRAAPATVAPPVRRPAAAAIRAFRTRKDGTRDYSQPNAPAPTRPQTRPPVGARRP